MLEGLRESSTTRTPAQLILAIEPDRRQADLIARMVRARLTAELHIAESMTAALEAIDMRLPDVILVNALLAPSDEAALADRLRELGPFSAHIQSLTTPILSDQDVETERKGGMLSAFRRSRPRDAEAVGCDPAVFSMEVAARLEQASAQRRELPPIDTEPTVTAAPVTAAPVIATPVAATPVAAAPAAAISLAPVAASASAATPIAAPAMGAAVVSSAVAAPIATVPTPVATPAATGHFDSLIADARATTSETPVEPPAPALLDPDLTDWIEMDEMLAVPPTAVTSPRPVPGMAGTERAPLPDDSWGAFDPGQPAFQALLARLHELADASAA